jgi:hypothetical protein
VTSAAPVREADGQATLELVEEGRRLGTYLLRAEPDGAALERYARACPLALGDSAPPEDLAMLRFVARHRWTLPLLDAACGLLRPQALLRKKLFLMLSILETLPGYAAVFTPRPSPRWRVMVRLSALGMLSVLLVLGGLLLFHRSQRVR